MDTILAFAMVGGLLGCEVETERGTILLFEGSQGTATLRALGLPEAATEISEIDESGPDGPMPEIALRTFRLAGEPTEIRQEFLRRCQAAGLGPADDEMLEMDPSTLCSQRSGSGVQQVILDPKCQFGNCRVSLEVRSTAR